MKQNKMEGKDSDFWGRVIWVDSWKWYKVYISMFFISVHTRMANTVTFNEPSFHPTQFGQWSINSTIR